MTKQHETATLAAGCFWCVEAVFAGLRGVESVVSGYAGGELENPSYEQVCSGETGHAEAVQITFDPERISFSELLEVFWRTHDPTTKDRQGSDFGSQYRSAIFCHDDRQREIAEQSRRAADAAGIWPRPIVTEIVAFSTFFAAERYHQDYYRNNRLQGYCRMIIEPKLTKLRKEFGEKLREPGGE